MSHDVTFRMKVEGSDEVQRKIEDAKRELEDLEKAAKDAKPALDDTGDALDNVKTSAGDAQGEIENVNTALDDTAPKADASKSSLDSLDTSYSNVSTSASDAQTNIANSVSDIESIDPASSSASSGLDAVKTAFDGVNSSAIEADQNIQSAVTGIEGIGTSTPQATSAVEGLGSAFEGAGTSTNNMNDALGQIGDQVDGVSGGITQANTVVGQFGQTAEQTGGSAQRMGTSISSAVGFFGMAAGAAVGLATSLSNLHGAQIRVEQMGSRLSTAQETEAKARQKLNELLASGTATTQEISQAELDLAQAHDKTQIAAERLDKSQNDLGLRMARFGSDVVPQAIQTVAGLAAGFGTLAEKIKALNFSQIALGAGGVGAAILSIVSALELLNMFNLRNEFFSENTLSGRIEKLKEIRDAVNAVPVLKEIQGPKLDADIKALEALKKKFEEQGVVIPPVNEMLDSYQTEQQNAAGGTKTTTDEIGKQNEALKPEQWVQVLEAMKDDVATQEKLTEILKKTNPELETQNKTHAELRDTIAGSAAGINQFIDAIQQIIDPIHAANDEIDNFTEGVKVQIDQSPPWNSALQQSASSLNTEAEALKRWVAEGSNRITTMAELNSTMAEHIQNIDRLNTTLGTAEGQQASYNNAVASGQEKFLEWNQSIRDTKTETETFTALLQAQAQQWGGLPAFMEPTIENLKQFNEAHSEQNLKKIQDFTLGALEAWRGLTSAAQPLFNDLMAAMDKITRNEFEPIQGLEGAFIDPVQAAFNKLPPLVQATMTDIDKQMLTSQAAFATVGSQAGMAWAIKMQSAMQTGTGPALDLANKAALDILTPFIAEHPEMADFMMPLMNALRIGTPDAIKAALDSMGQMPGPAGEIMGQVTDSFNSMGEALPGATKTGVEGAIQELGGLESGFSQSMQTSMDTMTVNMVNGFSTIVEKLNTLIKEIKQDPADVPKIDADTNPANQSIQTIERSLKAMQDHMNENKLFIAINSTPAEATLNNLSSKIDAMAGKTLSIVINTGPAGEAISQLQQKLDVMAGKTIAITVNTGPAGIAITGLQTQIDAMHGKTIDMSIDTGPPGIALQGLQQQIDAMHGKTIDMSVDAGPPGIALQGLQQQIDAMHGKTIDMAVDTGPAGIALTNLQNDIDAMHGKEVAITVNTGPAMEAIRQLQQAISSVSQPIGGYSGQGYGGYYGGGAGYGFAARGFGPAFVTKPTRLLVGEAGPEFVSVIPMKNRGRMPMPVKTAQAGMGYQGSGGGGGDPYGGFQDATAQGTEQGMDQSMGGMQDAVSQGVQQGMQQGYQQAPSNTELFGAGRFTWSAGGMGGGGGAQYPQAPSNTELWGAGKFTWGGGAAGPQLGGGNMGGAQYPVAPSDTSLFGTGTRFTWTGGQMGTSLGIAASKSFVKEFETGVKNQSQFINGVPATILGGNSNAAQQTGFQAGQSTGRGFAEGFGSGAADMMQQLPEPSTPYRAGTWTPESSAGGFKVPASYGPPLGQNINGIPATILPGSKGGSTGPSPYIQAQKGFFGTLKRDTTIRAHRGERVAISPRGRGGGQMNDKLLTNLMQMLTRIMKMQSQYQIDFNVDGVKMGRVANRNMGLYGYGDRGG